MVLAHHQDDQIETVFSQLMRGSDIHNIAAMRDLSNRGKSILLATFAFILRHS